MYKRFVCYLMAVSHVVPHRSHRYKYESSTGPTSSPHSTLNNFTGKAESLSFRVPNNTEDKTTMKQYLRMCSDRAS